MNVSGHEGVHSLWPGAMHDKGLVVSPWKRLPAEQENAGLRWRSKWPEVFVDLYTSRLRDMNVTVMVVSLVIFGRAVSNVANVNNVGSTLSFDNEREQCSDILRADICLRSKVDAKELNDVGKTLLLVLSECLAGTLIWLLVAAVLHGNNAFVGTSRVGKVLLGVLAIILCLGGYREMYIFLDHLEALSPMAWSPERTGGSDAEVHTALLLTMELIYVCLSLAGFWTCVNAILTPTRNNAFHASELNALQYTTSYLKPPSNVAALRLEPPKTGEVLLLSPEELGAEASLVGFGTAEEMKVVVTTNNRNGTCDVARADGRPYKTVLYKYLRREGKERRTWGGELRNKFRERTARLPTMFLIAVFCCLPILIVLMNLMFEAVNTKLAMLYQIHAVASFGRWADETIVAGSYADTKNLKAQNESAKKLLEWLNAGGEGSAKPPLWFRYGWERRTAYECGHEDHEPAYKFAAILAPYKDIARKARDATSDERVAIVQHVLDETELYDMPPEAAELVLLLLEGLAEKTPDGNIPLSTLDLGYLICEAKLLQRWYGFSTMFKTLALPTKDTFEKAQNLTAAIVKNASAQIQDRVGRTGHPFSFSSLATFVVRRFEVAALILVRDPTERGVRTAMEALFPGRALDMIMQVAKGRCVDLTLLISIFDVDGDGALGLEDEATGLVEGIKQACQHVQGTCPEDTDVRVWEALYRADFNPKDDKVSVKELRTVAQMVQTLLQATQQSKSGVCEARGVAELLDGAHDWTSLQDSLDGDIAKSLQEVLDTNGDSGITTREVADAAKALQAADLSSTMSSFFRSDIDGDGQLTLEELKGGDLAPTLLKLCPGIATSVDVIGVGNATEAPSACNYSSDSLNQTVQTVRFDDIELPFGQAVSLARFKFLKFMGEKWMAWILISVRVVFTISLFFAALFTVNTMVIRYPRTFNRLSSQMQTGDGSYPGATHWRDMKSGFAESAMFPGILAGTVICSFVTCTIAVFVLMVLLALLILDLVLPTFGNIIMLNRVIIYAMVGRAIFNAVFRNVILNTFLATNGEIIHPRLFTVFYFMQLFISFPLGIGLAFFRVFVQICRLFFTSSYLDATVLPESVVPWDSGYYSFLCVTYTTWMRQNPLRKSMVTAMMGEHTHRVHGVRDEGEKREQQLRQRVRNRFNVAVTLFRNPELRKFRRVHGQKPEPGGPTPDFSAPDLSEG